MQCLIIDDNPKTSTALTSLLEAFPVVAKVHRSVLPSLMPSLMATENIEIVFIRVRLWDFRQFEKLGEMPVVVFLSGGKDKLTLKPGTAVRYSLREPYTALDLVQLFQKIENEHYTKRPDYLFLRYDGRFHKTLFSDIEMIERKEGNYVQFYLNYGSWLLPGTLPGWITKLPHEKFVRVSDTLIVPASELPKITGDQYEYKGRKIQLTFCFAAAAKKINGELARKLNYESRK